MEVDADEQARAGCMRSQPPKAGALEWYVFHALIVVQVVAMAAVVAVELSRGLRARRRLGAVLRRCIVGCRRRVGPRGDASAEDRKAEAKVQELRVQWARGLWPVVVLFWLPWSTGWMVWKLGSWHGLREDAAFADPYLGSVLLHAAVSVAGAVTMLRPSLVTSAFLDRLHIVLSVLFHAHVLFVVAPDGERGCLLSLLGHGVLGILCGNAALSTVLNTSFGILGVVQYAATCTATSVVEASASACTMLFFILVAMWTMDHLMHRWARLLLREAEVSRDLSLIERLLSGMCDACVLLGPQQDIVKVPSLCCSFLSSEGESQTLAGRKFEDFVVESERSRVAEFFDSGPRCGFALGDDVAGSIHTSMQQPGGIVLPVQIYHASLGGPDESVHIICIKEEQEGRTVSASASGKKCSAAEEECEWWPPEADGSDSGESLNDYTTFPARDTEINLCFSVIDGGDADVFPVVAVSPAFEALFGIRSIGPDADVADVASLLSDSVCAKFEDWVHAEWLRWTNTGNKREPGKSKWFHFCVPGLHRLGVDMVALCSMKTIDTHGTVVKVKLEKLRWKRRKQQPPSLCDL